MTAKDEFTLGDAIQSSRRRAMLTCEQLAQGVGVSAAYVSMLENGHRTPSIDVVKRIAEVVGVPSSTLLLFLDTSPGPSKSLDLVLQKARVLARGLLESQSGGSRS